MYLPGQIVYDLDNHKPIQIGDPWELPGGRNTHFIANTGKFSREGDQYRIATPATVEEAADLLAKNLITPAACPPSHCWKCRNWLSNHNKDGSCWTVSPVNPHPHNTEEVRS